MALFNFNLKPFSQCYGDYSHKKPDMSWFWFTYSDYWFEFGNKKVLKVTEEYWSKYSNLCCSCYFEYPFIRFLEDFFEVLPYCIQEIPKDIFSYIDTYEKVDYLLDKAKLWLDDKDDDSPEFFESRDYQIYEQATQFLLQRNLSMSHINTGRDCFFLRFGNEVFIYWDVNGFNEENIAVWQDARGSYKINYNVFVNTVKKTLDKFFIAMDAQVENIAQYCYKEKEQTAFILYGKECIEEGLKILFKEHKDRKDYFYGKIKELLFLSNNCDSNWQKVKKSIGLILQKTSN